MPTKAQKARRERRRLRRERLTRERAWQRMKRQRSAAKKLRNEYFGRARGGLTLRFVKVGMALPWDGETPLDGEGMASYLRLCVAAGLLQYLVSPEDED